jgi:hypothetical protein
MLLPEPLADNLAKELFEFISLFDKVNEYQIRIFIKGWLSNVEPTQNGA